MITVNNKNNNFYNNLLQIDSKFAWLKDVIALREEILLKVCSSV